MLRRGNRQYFVCDISRASFFSYAGTRVRMDDAGTRKDTASRVNPYGSVHSENAFRGKGQITGDGALNTAGSSGKAVVTAA